MVIINLSQSLKNKRDAEFRRNQSRSDKRLIIDSEGNVGAGDSKDYLTQAVTKLNNLQGDISLAEGDNITLDVVGNEIVISSSGGGLEELPQATDTDLGGIRASERTANEISEVKIDLATGKLYAPAPDSAVNGVPTGGRAGQVLAKIDDTNYSAEWADVSGDVKTTVLFGPLTLTSSRRESAVYYGFKALTSSKLEGLLAYTKWDKDVLFTAKLWDGSKNVIAEKSLYGDGAKEWKDVFFDVPYNLKRLTDYYVSVERESGAYYMEYCNLEDFYANSFAVLLDDRGSGLPSNPNSATGVYAIGLNITI